MNATIRFLLTDHGPALRHWARVAGAVVALVITLLWIAGDCAYDLGRQLRLALEERNDQLAAAWVRLLGVAREAAPAAATEGPAAPVGHLVPIALLPVAAASLQRPARPARAARRRKPRASHKATAAA